MDYIWPLHTSLNVVKPTGVLRSRDSSRLTIPRTKGTFQDAASQYFNDLPRNIKNCTSLASLVHLANALRSFLRLRPNENIYKYFYIIKIFIEIFYYYWQYITSDCSVKLLLLLLLLLALQFIGIP